MSFQDRLRYFREINGMTKAEFSRKLGIESYSTYNNYEYGTGTPKLNKLIEMADILNISLDDLLGREIPRPMCTLTEIKNKVMGEVKKQKKTVG